VPPLPAAAAAAAAIPANVTLLHCTQVWYGVPAEAAAALDAAMRDALPHLFERDRLLLHKLITMLSPSQLVARGVPVCRAVQIPGSFVVTFPDAYHAGFNSGFNVAEAVNFAAPDWLPFGSSSVVRYRCAAAGVVCEAQAQGHDSLHAWWLEQQGYACFVLHLQQYPGGICVCLAFTLLLHCAVTCASYQIALANALLTSLLLIAASQV
jgi:histone demethylase JARID1